MYKTLKKHFVFLGLLGCCLLISAACKKDRDNLVPYVPIEVTLNLNLPSYAPLQNPGGWVYINGGSQGIIVYRATLDEFAVFDRHCTYEVQNACRVVVDSSSSIIARDYDCCQSAFSIVDGNVVNSPAERPLESYNYMYNPNNNTLRIYN